MDKDSSASQQIAEYAMALDLSSQLTLVLEENDVLHGILDIFAALFAPQQIVLWVMENGSVTAILNTPESGSTPPPLPDPSTLPETIPAGFRLRIPSKDETIAIIQIDGLAFPAYRERYLSLSLGIAGVCGLALSNARAHSRLEIALSDLRKEYSRSSQLSNELRIANEELETRVRDRTAELETAMVQLREEVRQRTAAEEVIRSQLDEKIILLRELNHRVKNNLQLITSMLSIQARKISDPSMKMALSESKNRIRTMSVIHEKLLSAQDLSRIDLEGLIRQIPPNLLSLYRIPQGSISISLDLIPVTVDINTAIPLGLILNELFSNSIKHAFPGGREGEITLGIRDGKDELLIRFADNGIGMPQGYDGENPETVGLILITSLVQQLQGTIEREPGTGTRFLIRLQKVSGESGFLQGTYNKVQE
ncbi:MAG: histidine kinase dimerization/phosphoacceptor domain -containing protein [Methanoregula sp.]|jgi:two-component sensor histidine kinase